jgi:peptidoglycan/LPS O-acetylase OafA/YrhL
VQRATLIDRRRVEAIDVLRGITILWITAFHFYVDTRGDAGDVSLAVVREAAARGDTGRLIELAGRTLIALPSYRLDVLLFVTGLVLSLSRVSPVLEFWKRRARAVLPNYWMGSLAAALVLVALGVLRAAVKGTPLDAEISDGTLLGRGPYHFEWTDILVSMSVVGRLTSDRAMQVMAPSMWYVLLVLQLYLLFPALGWLYRRTGPWPFLVLCTAAMFAGRWLVLEGWTLPGFSVASTLLFCLPLRLFAPALGMVAAGYVDRLPALRPRTLGALVLPALAVLLFSIWFGGPMSHYSVWGCVLPLIVGLPPLWIIASSAQQVPRAGAILTWVGAHSVSLLVVQDLMRLGTGTAIAFWGRPDAVTWYAMPAYVAAAVALTPLWHTVPAAVAAWTVRRPVDPVRAESARP